MRPWALKMRLWIHGMLGAGVPAQWLCSLGFVTAWHFQTKADGNGQITDNQTQTVAPRSPSLNGTSSNSLPTSWAWGSKMRPWRITGRLWALK